MAITNNEIKFLKGAFTTHEDISGKSNSNENAIMFTTGTPRMYVGGDVWYGNLSLVLANDKIQLKNGSGETAPVIGEVETTSFVKDGMLDSAELVNEMPDTSEGAVEGAKVQGTFIKLVWNTDAKKQPMYVDVASLVPNLTNYLTGVTVDGVTASVANNIATVNTPYVSGITINSGDVVTATNHVINLDIEDSGVTAVTVNDVEATAAAGDAKKLEVTIKGSDIELSDEYAEVNYPEAFTAAIENEVESGDAIDEAVHKVDTKVAALADEMIKNEQVVAIATQALANAAGTVENGGVIKYVQNPNAEYINNATSLADADNKLDAAIKNLSDAVTELENKSIEIDNFEDSAVKIENNTNGIGAKLYWGTLE